MPARQEAAGGAGGKWSVGARRVDQGQQRSICYQGREIVFRLLRSRRRTLALTLDPEEGLLARAPLGASGRQVDELVLGKAAWVLKNLERLARRGLPPPPRAYQEGEMFPYLGRDHALTVLRSPGGGRPRVELGERRLLVYLGQDLGPQARRLAVAGALARWYRRQAGLLLPPRAAYFALALGLNPPAVRVRDQKRRWGSCSSRGYIHLNWRLVMAPPELLDYVAAHEACHLLQADHSPGFWRLLAGLMPDCRERRQRLNQLGPFLRL